MRLTRCAVLVATLLLAGCGGSAAVQSAVAPTQGLLKPDSRAGRGGVLPVRDAWLFVAGSFSNVVYAYDLSQPGSPPVVETITQGINNPGAITLDDSGALYVENGGRNGSVTVYPAGQTTPSLMLSIVAPRELPWPTTATSMWPTERIHRAF
jgi:hypothetical protein